MILPSFTTIHVDYSVWLVVVGTFMPSDYVLECFRTVCGAGCSRPDLGVLAVWSIYQYTSSFPLFHIYRLGCRCESTMPVVSREKWRRGSLQAPYMNGVCCMSRVNFCFSFISSSSVEESSRYYLLEGWHAAMSGTSEEDDRCTSFGIKLK